LIGKSAEAREISSLVIKSGVGNLCVFIVGCHHAREWISVEVPLGFASKIINGGLTSAENRLIQQVVFYIIPMLNPDGHNYSTTPDTRSWRKSRRAFADGRFGTDLNRNYSVSWDDGMSDENSLSDMYCGPSAFSEPEVVQLAALLIQKRPNAIISYHSYGEKVLYPWAHKSFPDDPCAALLAAKDLADAYARGTGAAGSAYLSQPLYEHYGVGVGGELGDWAFVMSEGSCLGLTIELSPSGPEPGFLLPSTEISRVVTQNWSGLVALLETLCHQNGITP